MYINDVDIKKYGGKLLDRNISPNRVSQNYTWEYTLDSPTFYGSALDFKDVLLYVLFEADSEEIFLKNLGRVSEEFRHGALVRFKNIDLQYTMYLTQKPDYERLNNRFYKVSFVLDGNFGLGERKVISGTNVSRLTVENNGVYASPALLTIKPRAYQSTLTIQGFEKTISLDKINANDIVIVDAESGQITINGNAGISKYNSFYLPKVKVGTSTILVSTASDITVVFSERY